MMTPATSPATTPPGPASRPPSEQNSYAGYDVINVHVFSLSSDEALVIPGRTGDPGVAASSEQLMMAEKLRSEEWETLVERMELGAG